MNNSASFLRCWESFLSFHFEQCSKPFTPYRLWFKILIRKHFKNDVVAHLGCSLSSPTPRCVRRPACAVANKALDFDKKDANRVVKYGCETQNPFLVESILAEYVLALLCRCIFCCWVSIWLRMFGPLWAVGPFNSQQKQIPWFCWHYLSWFGSSTKSAGFLRNCWSNLLNSTFNLWGTQRSTDRAQ